MKRIYWRVREKLKNVHLIRIAYVFYTSVWKGFLEYVRLKERYGVDVQLVSCTSKGTGDYYLQGLYFNEWLLKHQNPKYVMLIGGAAERKVLHLFPHLGTDFNYEILDWTRYTYLVHLRVFLGAENTDIHIFHHIAAFGGGYTFHLWITWLLMGYKGLSQTDFYLYYGFGLPKSARPEAPVFNQDAEEIDRIFKSNRLIKGKTALISPYSSGNGELPHHFWDVIVKELLDKGFTVCTNCAGNEKPLKDTVKLNLKYEDSVPFLNKAGYFLAIRSGLCDIVSSAACKKMVVHTYYAQHWPAGNSVAYTGLQNMRLCRDAIEYELAPENKNWRRIQNKILVDMGVRSPGRRKQKTIEIKFVDVPPDFDAERHWITRVLRERYDVVFSDQPDFLFYSVFGLSFDQYQNCVKIFFTGEDTIPNFNECDYAMGHDPIVFGDRYMRADMGESYGMPIGDLPPDWIMEEIDSDQWINSGLMDIREGIQDRSIVSEAMLDRKFCNFVYSNDVFGDGAILRKQFCMDLMNQYKQVDCPGRILTNMKDGIPLRWGVKDGRDSISENWAVSKLEFIKRYKFTIAFENTMMAGHTTEKLIHPLYAYSVPIYWGNPEVTADFNPKAFINCNDYDNDMRKVIRRVIELDRDDGQYLEMLRQPPMQKSFDFHQEEKARQFLFHIIEKGNKPFTKCSLEFSAPNQARKSFREIQPIRQELQTIKNTNSWKLMLRLQRFADSRWGRFPKKIFKGLIKIRRKFFTR